jgi:hypothetical protein
MQTTSNLYPTPPGCPACAIAQQNGARFCPQCGQTLSIPSTEPSAITIQPPQSNPILPPPLPIPPVNPVATLESKNIPQSGPTILCSCGQSLPAQARFCYGCGHAIAAPTPKPAYRLISKGNKPMALDLTSLPIILGKSPDCQVCIADDEYVSRQHARISIQDDQVVLDDLHSSNGTFIKINKPFTLTTTDEFLVGSHLFRLEKLSE